MKKHFSDEEWINFIRRLLRKSQSDAMQQHLDEGCENCNKVYRIWSTVARLTEREVQHAPNEAVVRVAKSIYETRRQSHLVPLLAQMIPLVFDSFMDQSTAVVRGQQGQSPARRLLHRTRSWAIDLRLEGEEGRRVSIVGQVLKSGPKPAGGMVAGVTLMRGDSLLAQTSTNEFGEFQLSSQRENNLRIYLDLPRRHPLSIALPDLDA